jgi:uncharacterized membrane protein (DUF485 family)
MRRASLIILGLIISILILSSTVNAVDISSSNHEVKITTGLDDTSVEETIILQGTADEYIEVIGFWIQNGAKDVKISVDNQNLEYEIADNIYTVNLSALEIKKNSQPIIEIAYKLNKEQKNYQKELIRNTSSFKVTFNGNVIYTSTKLIGGISINLLLYQPTTAEETLSWYLILGIVLLLILLVVVTIYSIRKPKPTKIKEKAIESEELLTTKKSLLMSLLKDVEKQHRSKEISDDTYHKLKEHYKNEAVETMKKLDDMKSKIK